MIRYLSLRKETPAQGYWDQTLLGDLLKDYQSDRQVIVIPGAYQGELVDDISMELAQYSKVLVILTSDEEGNFPHDKLYHPDMRIVVTYPYDKHRDVNGYLPIGYCPDTRKLVKENGMSAKSLDWFFSGQANHQSRRDCVEALQGVPNGKMLVTDGFAQGLEYSDYMALMCRAKVVPCPAGNVNPDSFRIYEALEAGCIPIPENTHFWRQLFGEVPFPVVDDWKEIPLLIQHYKDRPDVANRCYAWWQLKKKELAWKISQY